MPTDQFGVRRVLSGNDLMSLTIPELKDMCRQKGLTVSGSKGQLLSRLTNANLDEDSAPSTFPELNMNFPSAAGPWARACVSRWKLVAPYSTEVTTCLLIAPRNLEQILPRREGHRWKGILFAGNRR